MAGAVAASGMAVRPILSGVFVAGFPVPNRYGLLPDKHRVGVVDNTNSGVVWGAAANWFVAIHHPVIAVATNILQLDQFDGPTA